MYGRFNNNEFEQAPVNFIAPDGTTICNFDRNTEMLAQYGFKEVQSEPMPDLAPNQMAEPVYSLGDNGEIIESWNITETDMPVDEPFADPSFDSANEPIEPEENTDPA